MNFRGNWEISRRDLFNLQFSAMVATDHDSLESEVDAYIAPTSRSLLCCCIVSISAAALLLVQRPSLLKFVQQLQQQNLEFSFPSLPQARSLSPPPASVEPSAAPPHPKSYMEIMAMVQRGERPPNIREINDLPPNPDQPVSNPRLAPKPKPWEAAQSQGSSTYPHENSNGLNSYIQDNGYGPASVYQSNGEGAAPWWQQKNVRITEAEPEENKTGHPGGSSERPVQRSSWVPPQPPPVAMAEAAAAIRQPKKSPFEKEQQLTDEQFLARSAEVSDELQRVTKISESGGVSDFGGGSSAMTNTSEIQREEDGSYYEA